MTWYERITQLREERDINQLQLATAADISKSYISLIEQGKHKSMSAHALYRVASALGTTVADILDEAVHANATDYKTLPAALRELVDTKAKLMDIRDEDVKMLAQIQYRGMRPKRAEDYEFLLQTIRLVTRRY